MDINTIVDYFFKGIIGLFIIFIFGVLTDISGGFWGAVITLFKGAGVLFSVIFMGFLIDFVLRYIKEWHEISTKKKEKRKGNRF